ncbi:DUF5610 domain-containing protein [Catenovulum agarivorans]|uniref:DUF5610 domain-containing protein n=1 Tax=Catenovulum agarivorans TaxID=1172192 RepID=UPI0002F3C936|nr:DUF5610 domain-containing protein [Catenovulum agarivorans]
MEISNITTRTDKTVPASSDKSTTAKADVYDAATNEQTKQAQQANSKTVLDQAHISQQSTSKLGLSILQQNFSQQLEVWQKLSAEKVDINQTSFEEIKARNEKLFDFEAVAKNVLKFVDGVITSAQESGAETEQLNDMLTQARKGVAKGVADAKKILGVSEEQDDDLANGIKKAHGLINNGLDDIYKRINGLTQPQSIFEAGLQSQTTESQSTKLELTTKDGDKVLIDFARLNEQVNILQTKQAESEQGSESSLFRLSSQYSQESMHFSVEGELDEDELAAIADLVKNVSSVADEFYNGDVEAAYEQALKLGFDQSEISNFALDLNKRVSQSTVAYQSYSENGQAQLPNSVKEPIMAYVEKLKDMVAQGANQLQDEQEVAHLVSQVFSNQFQLTGNELLEAVNRFNHFNQQLLNGSDKEKGE